ncbi:MAG: hypothetical protein HY901_31195 [Deltaproteobacteria bacterium]|nr:hypothetical protein [Deltaproteobacteria bacterium]
MRSFLLGALLASAMACSEPTPAPSREACARAKSCCAITQQCDAIAQVGATWEDSCTSDQDATLAKLREQKKPECDAIASAHTALLTCLGAAACSDVVDGLGHVPSCDPQATEWCMALKASDASCGQNWSTISCNDFVAHLSLKAPEVPKETLCTDLVDNDGDGTLDCDDPDCAPETVCAVPEPTPCTAQRECGSIVNELVTKCCLEGKCVAPGRATHWGEPVLAGINLDLAFNSTLTGSQKPKSLVVRFLYPKKIDGSPLTCAEVIGKVSDNTKNCEDQSTRSRIDTNPSLNQVYRALFPLDFAGCGGTSCQFSMPAIFVPAADTVSYILYGEAWYGPRDSTDPNNPTGQCAAYFCAESQKVTVNDAHYGLTFSAQQQ